VFPIHIPLCAAVPYILYLQWPRHFKGYTSGECLSEIPEKQILALIFVLGVSIAL